MRFILGFFLMAALAAGQTEIMPGSSISTLAGPTAVFSNTSAGGTYYIIDGTYARSGFCGFWHTGSSSAKTIDKIAAKWGTVTKTGGSGVRWSIEDPGSDGFPDGTQDAYIDIANGSIGTGNEVTESGTVTGTKTLTHGQRACFVQQFDGSGRQGSDSIGLYVLNNVGSWGYVQGIRTARYTNAWNFGGDHFPTVYVIFTDGTYGWMMGSGPGVVPSSINVNSTTTSPGDEVGNAFQLGAAATADRLCIWVFVNSGAEFDLALYNSAGSRLAGITLNRANQMESAPMTCVPIAATSLSANTTYYFTARPLNSTNVAIRRWTFPSSAIRAAYLGTTMHGVARTDAAFDGNSCTGSCSYTSETSNAYMLWVGLKEVTVGTAAPYPIQ